MLKDNSVGHREGVNYIYLTFFRLNLYASEPLTQSITEKCSCLMLMGLKSLPQTFWIF